MEFRKRDSIYLQIADIMCENILTENWVVNERIPSVREMAVSLEVNPNTVMRAYAYLQDKEIIFNKRGIGYFVADDAYQKTVELMKTSNKILLISSSTLMGIVIVFLLLFRLTLGNSITTERGKDSDKPTVFREFPLTDFTAIEVSGHWEIELARGETTQVKFKAPGDVMENLSVEKQAGTLILRTDKKWRSNPGKVTALITMPSLSDLRVSGLVSLELSGFSSESLTINTTGSTSITGKGNHIHNLHLKGEGLSNLNLRQNSVINADLRYKGVYKIELSMAGGELTGKIKGVGKVIYTGEVREENIRKDGPCKVIRE